MTPVVMEENNIEYNKKKIVAEKPTKDELIELLKNNTKASIARMFDVSWAAVNKWCKKYNLQ